MVERQATVIFAMPNFHERTTGRLVLVGLGILNILFLDQEVALIT